MNNIKWIYDKNEIDLYVGRLLLTTNNEIILVGDVNYNNGECTCCSYNKYIAYNDDIKKIYEKKIK